MPLGLSDTLIVCSCGKTTVLRWVECHDDVLGDWRPDDPNWRFVDRKHKWTCGVNGHTQTFAQYMPQGDTE